MILSAMSKLDSFVQLIAVLFIFIFVCILTYFSTRFIANIQKGQMNGSNFDIVDTFKIAPTKYIQIIRIADKYVAIAVCKDTVEVITEIEENALVISDKQNQIASFNFKEILEKAKKKKQENK